MTDGIIQAILLKYGIERKSPLMKELIEAIKQVKDIEGYEICGTDLKLLIGDNQ